MNFDYLWLFLATAGLWIPAVIVSSSKIRQKLRQATRRHHDGVVSLARAPLNWIDLIRAIGCTWIIQWVLSDVPSGQNDLAIVYLIAKLVIVGMSVGIQCILIGKSLRIVGPVFFLIGVTLVFSGPLVGGFAIVLGLACALMFKRLSLVFLFTPGFLVVFAKVFGKIDLVVLFNACLFAAPLFMAFAFNRRLSFVRRPAETNSIPTQEESEATYTANDEKKLAAVTPIFDPQADTVTSKQNADRLKGPAIA